LNAAWPLRAPADCNATAPIPAESLRGVTVTALDEAFGAGALALEPAAGVEEGRTSSASATALCGPVGVGRRNVDVGEPGAEVGDGIARLVDR
jgi:hypothetical protein